MPAERGNLIANIAIGFTLLILAMYLGGSIHQAHLPGPLRFLEFLPFLPFLLFYRWAVPNGLPLWMDLGSIAVVACGLAGIPRVLKFFEIENSTVEMLLTLVFVISWSTIRDRWLRAKSPEA